MEWVVRCEVVGNGSVKCKGVKLVLGVLPEKGVQVNGKARETNSPPTDSGEICLDTNLVDPASSHTLVSKIKPCMCKCKCTSLELRMAHYISYSLFGEVYYLDNRSNSRANT